jgi:hypothetical protein
LVAVIERVTPGLGFGVGSISFSEQGFVQILYNRIGTVAFLVLLAVLQINNLHAINVLSCSDPD